MTVASILELPEISAGRPEVIAETTDLSKPVRWTHVLESPKVLRHLRGSEVVLSTGVGWDGLESFDAYVADLKAANASALILELGTYLDRAPQALIDASRNHKFPLVILHETVAFIVVTEAIHRSLISVQTQQLQARQDVAEHFTELMRSGTPLQSVLEQAARVLQTTLVVEDPSYNVLFTASTTLLEPGFYTKWQSRTRAEHRAGNPRRSVAPIEARGQHFGTLVCAATAQHPAGVGHVLTLAATAIGMDLLTGEGRESWRQGAQHEVLQDLLQRRINNPQLLAGKLQATGFELAGRSTLGFAWRAAPAHGPATREANQLLSNTASDFGLSLITSTSDAPSPKVFGLVAATTDLELTARLRKFAQRFTGQWATASALCFGSPAKTTEGMLDSVHQAVALCDLQEPGREAAHFAQDHPVAMLAHELRHEPALQRLPQQNLGTLLALDAERGTDYISVLEAYLRFPTNRSKAAEHSHLSRSVFYQRLASIEQLLDCDLNDAQTITMLLLSLLVHRGRQDLFCSR